MPVGVMPVGGMAVGGMPMNAMAGQMPVMAAYPSPMVSDCYLLYLPVVDVALCYLPFCTWR